VEFGTPIEVPPELLELYKKGERREAVGKLLDDVYNALVSVTVTAPDYDTLMVSNFRCDWPYYCAKAVHS
jgi:glycerol-3-phosphate O-acyltransferase / dihydroxyacetone phosphate acyltransferase